MDEIYQHGVHYPYTRMVLLSVTVNKNGDADKVSLPRGTGDRMLDDRIIEICEPLLKEQHYSPAKHRGYSVDSNIGMMIYLHQ